MTNELKGNTHSVILFVRPKKWTQIYLGIVYFIQQTSPQEVDIFLMYLDSEMDGWMDRWSNRMRKVMVEFKWYTGRFSPTACINVLGYMRKHVQRGMQKMPPWVIILASLFQLIHFLGSWRRAGERGKDRTPAGLQPPLPMPQGPPVPRIQGSHWSSSESRVLQVVLQEASTGALDPGKYLLGQKPRGLKITVEKTAITLVERKFLKQKSNKKKDIPPECKKNYTPQLWRGQNEHWIYSGNTQFPKKEKDEDAGKDPGRKEEKRKKKKKKKSRIFHPLGLVLVAVITMFTFL